MKPRRCGSYWLLDEVDAGLQVEAEIDEVPLDALALVLLLLQDEHGVVEELLQLLVGVVDTQLLEGVQLQEGDKVTEMPTLPLHGLQVPREGRGRLLGKNLLGPLRAAPCGPTLLTPSSRGCTAGAHGPRQQPGKVPYIRIKFLNA